MVSSFQGSKMTTFASLVILHSLCSLWFSDAFLLQNSLPPQRSRLLYAPAPNDPPKRRQKVNKYRPTNDTKDPLEKMIDESERKIQQLNIEAEVRNSKNRGNKDLVELKKTYLQFALPDSKDIDPNDPSSFGFVEIGTVVGPHGVHGLIKVRSSSDFPSRFTEPGLRYFKPQNKRAPRKVVLLHGKPSKEGEYILQLDEATNRDEATRLRGGSLYVRIEDRDTSRTVEETGDLSTTEEFFISDLVGLEVFLETESDSHEADDRQNQFVGYVAGIVLAEETSSVRGLGHDMLEVILPRGRGGTTSLRDELVLIPFVPEIVPRVAISEQSVFISPPAGLLDLTYVREEKVRIKGFLPAAD